MLSGSGYGDVIHEVSGYMFVDYFDGMWSRGYGWRKFELLADKLDGDFSRENIDKVLRSRWRVDPSSEIRIEKKLIDFTHPFSKRTMKVWMPFEFEPS
jgi:hypothetical protein